MRNFPRFLSVRWLRYMLDQITALGRTPGPIGNDLPLTLVSFAELRRPKIITALGRFPGPIGNDFHR